MDISYRFGTISYDYYKKNKKGNKEMLFKNKRPYFCLFIKYNTNFYMCLPFRTNINHNQAFHFTESKRSKHHKSGLDYSKMLLIEDIKYLKDSYSIDQDEYVEALNKIDIIFKGATNYLETYKNHICGKKLISKNRFIFKYKYSTLQYFHDILNTK